jgi:dihydrofolate synthase/folylpolyglutamate synthase
MTLAALLQACGQRVGLFTSPHLIRYNERIRIDGVAMGDAELIESFERIEAARAELTLTFFEYNTLAALELFRRGRVTTIVLEVGLGGRLDATNMIDAEVAVLCSVGFDHRDWLGETLEQIGSEKAGIFRRHQNVVLGSLEMPSSVWRSLRELECEVWTAQREFDWQLGEGAGGGSWDYRCAMCELPDLPAPRLAGAIQYRNTATALTALQLMRVAGRCDRARVAQGLSNVILPGRFQIVPGKVEWILDVAHNEPAAQVLASALAARPCKGRTIAVVGILSDKDIAAIALALDLSIDHWVLTGIDDDPRGMSASALRARMPPLRGGVELAADTRQACERARQMAHAGDRIVVLGSFHVVGPALAWLGLY